MNELEGSTYVAYDDEETDECLMSDQLEALMKTEKSYIVKSLPCFAEVSNDRVPLEDWRRKICQWAFRVIDHFRLDREVVATGMNLFDRFLVLHESPHQISSSSPCCRCPCCKRNVDSRTYQLAAMTAIFLAAKLNAVRDIGGNRSPRKQFKLSTFVELSRGQFTSDDICAMEQQMLNTLQWKVSPPTPMLAVSYLLALMPQHDQLPLSSKAYYDLVIHILRELSRYLTELATCLGGSCSIYSASTVAYSAILVSMELLTTQALPSSVRDTFRRSVFQITGIDFTVPVSGVPHLRNVLEGALWPEMLLDDTSQSGDSTHPLAIARQYGMLNLNRICGAQQGLGHDGENSTPLAAPESPKHENSTAHPETSPVSAMW